jgi:hypothetical protein
MNRTIILFVIVGCGARHPSTNPDGGGPQNDATDATTAACETSCSGCCTATGECQDGTTVASCGLAGVACASCSQGQGCSAAGLCDAGKLVLFGGSAGGTPLDDTWTFDVATQSWTQLQIVGPNAGPAKLATLGNHVVAFTGTETWSFDGTAWTQVAGAGPSPRSGFAMASLDNAIVLFGGSNAATKLSDTWLFDGAVWTTAAAGPPARANAAMARLGGSVILVGGQNSGNTSISTVWSFDGTTWTQLADSPDAFGPGLATLGNEVVMYRGPNNAAAPDTTWTFDGTTWTRVTTATLGSSRSSEAMATIGVSILLVGGFSGQAATANERTFDGTSWTELVTTGPSARGGAGMAWLP